MSIAELVIRGVIEFVIIFGLLMVGPAGWALLIMAGFGKMWQIQERLKKNE